MRYVVVLFGIIYLIIKDKKAMHMLQQNLYNENNRYVKWMKKNSKESINLARISYALAMIEPKNLAQRENYNKFTNLIIENINSKENIKKLITTIILIIYLNREREE